MDRETAYRIRIAIHDQQLKIKRENSGLIESHPLMIELMKRIQKLVNSENYWIEKCANDDTTFNNKKLEVIQNDKKFYFELLTFLNDYDNRNYSLAQSVGECIAAYANGAELLEMNNDLRDVNTEYNDNLVFLLKLFGERTENDKLKGFTKDLAMKSKKLLLTLENMIKKWGQIQAV